MLSSFLLSIQAKNLKPKVTQYEHPATQRKKFGIQAGMGILFFLTRGTGMASFKAGFFGEYKVAKWLGIQTGITSYYNLYIIENVIETTSAIYNVAPVYLMAPILLRIYPGKARQNCFSMGSQIGYLITGYAYSHKDIYEQQRVFPILLKSQQLSINRLGLSILAGYDYEFTWGLILGLNYIHDYIPVLKADYMSFEWSVQPTISYNFGRFF